MKIIFLTTVLLSLPIALFAQSTKVAIEFMSRNELVWAQYKSNKSQIETLYSLLNSSVDQIKQGNLKVQIQSTATSFDTPEENKQLAIKRSIQLLSLLSSKYKITEDNCQISNLIVPLSGKSDVIYVSLINPSVSKTVSTNPKPASPTNLNPPQQPNKSAAKSTPEKETPAASANKEKDNEPPLSPILTNTKPDNKPRNFLKPPTAPKSPQEKYSL